MASEDTPLMLQWREVKARHPDALVFFRVGDFYELFNDDAVEGSKLLDLTHNHRGRAFRLAGNSGALALR
jgi:DNA mismatch repair protein MutS